MTSAMAGRPARPRAARRLIACLFALALTLGCLATDAAQAAGPSTLGAVADTYSRSDRPTTNYGTSNRLDAAAGSATDHGFLRFEVSVPQGNVVTKATLRVYALAAGGTTGVTLRGVPDTTWGERTLTWRNEPAMEATVVDQATGYAKGSWVSLNAASLVKGAGPVSVGLATSATNSRTFSSREATGTAPQLVVETEPAVAPTPTPTATPTVAASPTPTTTPTAPPSTATAAPRFATRGMYDRDSGGGFTAIAGAGFNLIDSGPNNLTGLDGTNTKGMVWVGDYSNCSWEVSDSTLQSYVQAHVGDPKVGVWFISDEPDWTCPNVTQQHRDRVALIKSIDPNAKTLTVLDSNSAKASLDQLVKFKDTTDYVGLDPYVCHTDQACAYDWIDRNAAAADAAGINYWGVAQAHADPTVDGYQWLDGFGTHSGSLRLPTAPEIHEQFNHWRASHASGMLTFAWRWPRDNSLLWLQNHPELQDQLTVENRI